MRVGAPGDGRWTTECGHRSDVDAQAPGSYDSSWPYQDADQFDPVATAPNRCGEPPTTPASRGPGGRCRGRDECLRAPVPVGALD